MDIYIINTTNLLNRCKRLISVMITVAIIIPTVAFSQTAPVLGTAASFGILAAGATTGTTTVTGNVGTTTGAIAGTITAPGYIVYASGDATVVTAHNDFGTAYTNALSANSGGTSLPATFPVVNQGNDVGHPLLKGIYDITSPASMTADLYLSGTASDIFIFKTSTTFSTTASTVVHLGGTAVRTNVYWLVGGAVTLGASSTLEGTILCNSGAITVGASAVVNGALLGNGAITVDATSVLPVELTSFTAALYNNAVELYWNTATEVNNYGFNVELRVGNGEWNKIGFVQGHGNSNSPKDYSFVDKNLQVGKLQYRLKQIDLDGTFEYSDVVELEVKPPKQFTVYQNYPNPFNPTTNISYEIPVKSNVVLKVFDVLGSEVAVLVNEEKPQGRYQVEFKASHLPSGIYFYSLNAGNNDPIMKKMILLK